METHSLIELIKGKVKADRRARFEASSQLTLGEFIDKLAALPADRPVYFGFGNAVPACFASWRWSYDELALGYKDHDAPTAGDLLAKAREAVGQTFTGWKGGDFTMTRHTPVWVANQGDCGHTMIVDVQDAEWMAVIVTAYGETLPW